MSRQREQKSFEYVKYLWQDEVADQALHRVAKSVHILGCPVRPPRPSGVATNRREIGPAPADMIDHVEFL